jgi:putative hemolysin
MSSTATVPARSNTGPYTASIAATPEQVRAAQRLRRHVFADELGARWNAPVLRALAHPPSRGDRRRLAAEAQRLMRAVAIHV